MLRLLTDENFSGPAVRGLRARVPGIDLVRVQEVGLTQTPDPDILAWCAVNDRVLVTHDQETVPGFAYDRVAGGEPMPGVFVVPQSLPVGRTIDELQMLDACSEMDEWRDRVVFLPI